MAELHVDDALVERLSELARSTGQSVKQITSDCMKIGLEAVELRGLIDRFSQLTTDQQATLADRAADFARSAQLMALDAQDGGYDWGPAGPPRSTCDVAPLEPRG